MRSFKSEEWRVKLAHFLLAQKTGLSAPIFLPAAKRISAQSLAPNGLAAGFGCGCAESEEA
jgi:hypothetical protein